MFIDNFFKDMLSYVLIIIEKEMKPFYIIKKLRFKILKKKENFATMVFSLL